MGGSLISLTNPGLRQTSSFVGKAFVTMQTAVVPQPFVWGKLPCLGPGAPPNEALLVGHPTAGKCWGNAIKFPLCCWAGGLEAA